MFFETNLLMINLYQCEKGFKTDERFLNNYYFLYVHSGEGKFKIDKTIYKTKAGDLYFCKKDIGNTIIADEQDPFLLTGVDFTIVGGDESILKIPEKINILSEQFLISLIFHMINEFKEGKIFSREICSATLKAFVYEVFKFSKLGFDNNENIKIKMLKYIEENYNEEITYKMLSSITNYHKNSINRIIKSITGMSLREYVITLRIKKATQLLLYSSKSVASIAELCGYNSPIFFSRQFKEKMGKKPLEFRKANFTVP
jgi:AraC-like DNA-binding protein